MEAIVQLNATVKIETPRRCRCNKKTRTQKVIMPKADQPMPSSPDLVHNILATKNVVQFTRHVVYLNAEDAAEILKHRNTHNRKVKWSNVKKIQKSIESREFTPNPSPIVFDEMGRLADGQTRLHAIVAAKYFSVPCIIMVGFPSQFMKNVDTDAVRRSIFDRMVLDGFDVTKRMVNICNGVINTAGTYSPSIALAEKTFSRYEKSIRWVDHNGGKLSMPILGVIVRAHSQGFNSDRIKRFLDIMNGESVLVNDWRDMLAVRFAGWYAPHGKSNPKDRKEIRARCEYVLGKYLFVNQVESQKIECATKELFPLEIDDLRN